MSDYEEIEERRTDGYRPENFQKPLEGDIKSSGETRDFGTGAHRDSNIKVLKGRMDLVPAVAVRRFAKFLTGEDTNPYNSGTVHSLRPYNSAMESLYFWLEGERDENDGGVFKYDYLSNALVCCQDIMHIDLDIPMWYPTTPPDVINGVGLRYDRISPVFFRRVSIHYQKGGINYGDRNWELGMPVLVCWDSATRHFNNWIEHLPEDNEDHMGAVGWNIMCMMHTIEMVRRGILGDDMYEPPMHHNIQKGKPFVMGEIDDDDLTSKRHGWWDRI